MKVLHIIFSNFLNFFSIMAIVLFPKSVSDIVETCTILFARAKADGKESPLRVITQHDYIALGDNVFSAYLKSTKRIDELRLLLSQELENRESLWEKFLKAAVMAAKNVLNGLSLDKPSILAEHGFIRIANPSKAKTPSLKAATKKFYESKSELDALRMANEKVLNEIPTVSITKNEKSVDK
jgi:hypothetical protein